MTEQTIRRRKAWLLLSVYLLMTVLLSLHVHAQGVYQEHDCYQCANHLPHSGHLSTAQAAMHDCVLCQLQTVCYVLATVTTLAVLLPATAVPFVFRCPQVQMGEGNSRSSRAPPYGV